MALLAGEMDASLAICRACPGADPTPDTMATLAAKIVIRISGTLTLTTTTGRHSTLKGEWQI